VHGRHGERLAGGGDAQVVGGVHAVGRGPHGHVVAVDDDVVDLVTDLEDLGDPGQRGDVAVGPRRHDAGRHAVVDEVGRDQVADAFQVAVVHRLQGRTDDLFGSAHVGSFD
jgi:hypothetical protein